MKDFFIPILGLQWFFANIPAADNPLWERLLEKWGIAFVGIALLFLFAKRTDRIAKDEQAERDRKDVAATAERNSLLLRNNQLQEEQISNQKESARILVQLTKDGNKAITDSEAATRMLIRKMKRPCVAPFYHPDDTEPEDTEPSKS